MGCGSSKVSAPHAEASKPGFPRVQKGNSVSKDLAYALSLSQQPGARQNGYGWGNLEGRKPSINLAGSLQPAYLQNQIASPTNSSIDQRAMSVKAVPGTQLHWTASRDQLETELQAANGVRAAGPGGGDDLQRLNHRLQGLGQFVTLEMEGDGNCQFRAISLNLYGSQEHHAVVRDEVVRHMHKNKDEFRPFLGEDWDRYMQDMARSGTWGDELTLKACCDAYQILISVLTSDEQHWFMRYKPKGRLQVYKGSTREMFLTYIAPVHYNTIRRLTRHPHGPTVGGGPPVSAAPLPPPTVAAPRLETLKEISSSMSAASGGSSGKGPETSPFAAPSQQALAQPPQLL